MHIKNIIKKLEPGHIAMIIGILASVFTMLILDGTYGLRSEKLSRDDKQEQKLGEASKKERAVPVPEVEKPKVLLTSEFKVVLRISTVDKNSIGYASEQTKKLIRLIRSAPDIKDARLVYVEGLSERLVDGNKSNKGQEHPIDNTGR